MVKLTEKDIIDEFLGIPYVHMGRSLDGLDCWGLIVFVYRKIGIEVLDLETYSKDWAKQGQDLFIENYYDKWEKQSLPKFLDVLLFKNSNGVAYHAGLYLSGSCFLQGSKAGVIKTRFNREWKKSLEGIYRHKDMKW